jgi:hypothetical protein
MRETRIAATLAANLDVSLLRIVSILMNVDFAGMKLDFVGIATKFQGQSADAVS